MYAVIREGAGRGATPGRVDDGQAAFAALRTRQPGFRGSLTVYLGGGKQAIVMLWESAQANEAARGILGPETAKLPGGASQVIYHGEVIGDDLTTR